MTKSHAFVLIVGKRPILPLPTFVTPANYQGDEQRQSANANDQWKQPVWNQPNEIGEKPDCCSTKS
jgi:hypothetical protein